MATQSVVSDSVDPLSGLNGPLLFPGTIRASANDDGSLPAKPNDLESIHTFMKSQKEQRSPEKLKNDAKRIFDGGAYHLESSIVGNAAMIDAIAAKVRDRPQERRPGLGLARKKSTFTLRTRSSQPSVDLEPVLNIDQLEDPDAFFDAYERLENAKKEIQKQMGGSMENLDIRNLPTRTRIRKPGILGKTYDIKHRYPIPNSENDGQSIISQEKEDHVTPSACNDDPQGKSIDLDPNPVVDLEKNEMAASVKKTGNKVTDILDELLSCNDEDLDGEGALNLLQERLNIKPLDMESLRVPDFHGVGRFSILSAGDSLLKSRKSLLKSRKSSHVIDSALKYVNKSPKGNEQEAQNPIDPVSSPTPPRSPFGSLIFLKNFFLQSNPLKDRFSPFDVDISESENVPTVHPIGKLQEHVDAVANLSMSSELNPRVEVENIEKICHMDAQKVIESDDNVPGQFVDENASVHRENAEKKRNEVSDYSIEETMTTNELNDNKSSSKKVIYGGDSLPDQFVIGDASVVQEDADDSQDNVPDYNTEETINLESQDPNLSNVQDVAMDVPSTRAEKQPTVNQADLQNVRKEVGIKRTRNAHPMRKSIADYGTTLDNGLRRSKRIKMRPLEYWKGERFLWGRMDDSLKLIGVKYISPEKNTANLKVKPYISSESSEYKNLLDLASRH